MCSLTLLTARTGKRSSLVSEFFLPVRLFYGNCTSYVSLCLYSFARVVPIEGGEH